MEYSLRSIACIVGGKVTGDDSVIVSGVNTLEKAGPSDLSFLADRRYLGAMRKSRAGAIICPDDIDSPGKTLLHVPNPHLAFGKAVELFHPEWGGEGGGIHPTAILGEGVGLGDKVTIGPYAVIGEGSRLADGVSVGPLVSIGSDVEIGKDTKIGPLVTVYHGVRIGMRCLVQAGVVLGSDGFSFAKDEEGHHHKIPQIGGLVIEDDVEIGSNCTIDRGGLDDTYIARGTKFDNLVHIAHNVKIGEDSLLVAQVGISGSTRVGKGVTLAGQAGIVGHIEIGDGAVIGAQAGVIKSVKEGEVVSGYPARPHRQALKSQALLIKLPVLIERINTLEEKLRELEGRSKEDKASKSEESL
jgi:UDP-3-O-[3-hydroxymyristoyl] glucosamine N-acyltransferase